jgi:hypothetical protein
MRPVEDTMPRRNRRRTRREKERLRAQAIELFEQGLPEDEIRRRTGADAQAIATWHGRWRREQSRADREHQGWVKALFDRGRRLWHKEEDWKNVNKVGVILSILVPLIGLLAAGTRTAISMIDRQTARDGPPAYHILASTSNELFAISDDGRVNKVANFGSPPPEHPAWSRDGSAVAWVVKPSANAVYGTPAQVRVVRADGRSISNFPQDPNGEVEIINVVAGGTGFIVQTSEDLIHLPDNGSGEPRPLHFDLQTLSQDYSPKPSVSRGYWLAANAECGSPCRPESPLPTAVRATLSSFRSTQGRAS